MAVKQVYSGPLTVSDATQAEELGTLRVEADGKIYKYGQADTSLIIGYVCGHSSIAGTGRAKFSPDISDCTPNRDPAGIALATISDEHFCYVQVEGKNTNVKTDGGVAAGEKLTWSADMVADTSLAASTSISFGVSILADSGSIATRVVLSCQKY